MNNQGEERILPFELVANESKIELSDSFISVKAVSINQKSIEVPLKETNNEDIDINHKLHKETQWLDSSILGFIKRSY